MRVAIVHGNDGSDVRIGKMCRTLTKVGIEVNFIGWDRTPDEKKKINIGNAKLSVMRLATKFGRATVLGQLRFGVFIASSLKSIRPDVCVAVNEDLALFTLPYKGFFYKSLVIDVFDALLDRHDEGSPFLVPVLKMIEKITRSCADRLIATDERRFKRFGKYKQKTVIIENFPEDPGGDLWCSFPAGPTKIYVAGTLTEGNGLRQILSAAHLWPEMRIVSAGWLRDDYASNVFAKDPQVEYRGVVTLQDSLQFAAECDAVFVNYEPSSTNSRLASPNKIFDAMSVGRPIIINTETGLGEWVVQNSLGYVCSYGDSEGISKVIGLLPEARNRLPESGKKARELFMDNYTWGSLEARLVGMYTSLSAK